MWHGSRRVAVALTVTVAVVAIGLAVGIHAQEASPTERGRGWHELSQEDLRIEGEHIWVRLDVLADAVGLEFERHDDPPGVAVSAPVLDARVPGEERVYDAVAILVDGARLLVVPDEATAEGVLDEVKVRSGPVYGEIVEQSFVENVELLPVVASEETIAPDAGTAVEMLLVEPPDRRALTVRSEVVVTVQAQAQPEVEKVHSVHVPRGSVRVASEGQPGRAELVERRTYLNRDLVDIEVLTTVILEPPIPRRVMVGTNDDQ